jgi:protein TonB
MEQNKILSADFLDILFDGKNKEYGAYELRKSYNRRIVTAITSMGTICLLFFLTQILANDKGKDLRKIEVATVQLESIKPKDEVKPEIPPVQPPKAEPPQVKMEQFTPPRIVIDDEVTDLPPTMETLEDAHIGLATTDGANDIGFVAPPVEASLGVVEGPKTKVEDIDKPFTKVEKEAKFPGGMEAWKRFLERTLNSNVAADDGAATGLYTVKVQFIVDKKGVISHVEAIEVPKACPSCGPEAVKVIKKGPNWEPAIQNGTPVIYQAIQYVTFQVVGEE